MAQELNLRLAVGRLRAEIDAREEQIEAAATLLDAGNTIPFIARYRKEATQGLDETALRAIEDGLSRIRELEQRKATVLKTIDEQGKLTDDLRRRIEACASKQVLEDLYLPFKPKRRTRAEAARERGLQPLADILSLQEPIGSSRTELLERFVNADQDVADRTAALHGASDIVAEQWSEDAETRNWLVEQAWEYGQITSQVKRGKREEASKFEMYFDHREAVKRVASHRVLAMKRGEAEGLLRLGIALNDDFVLRKLKTRLVHERRFEFHQELLATVEDCYRRLLQPAMESTVISTLKETADDEAIRVFGKNLRELLMAPPAGPQVTIGIDPGFRTGCKLAVVDGTGGFVESATIYPTAPRNDVSAASATLFDLIRKHDVKLLAIGNGTASRETDQFVTQMLKERDLNVTKVLVSEAGASVYSASEVAVREYPELDVTVRGAISIAHRLQDPLAELVKIDPKSIGVGQYQHDVNPTQLKRCLQREVESCVNSVGVDLNMASAPLLSHVAGIGPKLAEGIVNYRQTHGRFETREQLCGVPKLGRKAFQQAAGFLRIRGGTQPLDNSAVHPESYYVVQKMADRLGTRVDSLIGNRSLTAKLEAGEFVDGDLGLPTIEDILHELAKPGRDPRKQFQAVRFSESVNAIQDLKQNMVLQGVVTNVTKFGAFVDIGVHQDGLIHISQLADQFVQDPGDVVSIGDIVRVRVLEVDLDRRRIALSLKAAT